jgi:hypothetical protein
MILLGKLRDRLFRNSQQVWECAGGNLITHTTGTCSMKVARREIIRKERTEGRSSD